MKKRIPTFLELLKAYPRIAERERIKSERPSQRTIWNVMNGVRCLLKRLGNDSFTQPITWMTEDRLDIFLVSAIRDGLSPVSAWSYVQQLKSLTASWTRRYYRALGFDVSTFSLPTWRRKAKRYARPGSETLKEAKEWYDSLFVKTDKRYWLVATLMLEFGMRNGDVARLRWSDFRTVGGQTMIVYMPNKTALTSARVVAWPVHPDVWAQLSAIRDSMPRRTGTHMANLVVPGARCVFQRMNHDLRERNLFTGSKRLYELRKICIDHIYQKFGAEMASSISGDDIRTVTRYYADPSAVNAPNIRIADLLGRQ